MAYTLRRILLWPICSLTIWNAKKKNLISFSKTYELFQIWNPCVVFTYAYYVILLTAIITHLGLYEFELMAFGLRNAAQNFQTFMEVIWWWWMTDLWMMMGECKVFTSSSTNHRSLKAGQYNIKKIKTTVV